jgi:hypothetical protein
MDQLALKEIQDSLSTTRGGGVELSDLLSEG